MEKEKEVKALYEVYSLLKSLYEKAKLLMGNILMTVFSTRIPGNCRWRF